MANKHPRIMYDEYMNTLANATPAQATVTVYALSEFRGHHCEGRIGVHHRTGIHYAMNAVDATPGTAMPIHVKWKTDTPKDIVVQCLEDLVGYLRSQ